MRFRNFSLILGCLAALFLIFLTDPDLSSWLQLPFGARAVVILKSLVMISVALLMVHTGRKTLFDYFDMGKALAEAMKTSTGAGLAVIGISLMMVAVAIVFINLSQLVI